MASDMGRVSRAANFKSVKLIFVPILAGMMTAHAIATCFVYISNSRTLTAAETIRDAGLLPIPMGAALATLKSFGAAFWGGLLFTLSIGIGLTLVTWAVFRLWDLLFKRRSAVPAGFGVLWLGLLIYTNLNGLALFPTLFCLLVPLTTVGTALWMIRLSPATKSGLWILPVASLLALTGLWSTQLDQHLFTTIRDHILLSNPAGRTVNDFYYRYTLHAAEAFKSFGQKTVRTGRLEGVTDNRLAGQLKILLAKHDVLVLKNVKHPDIRMVLSNSGVTLVSAKGRKIKTTLRQFISDPGTWLNRYSDTTDHLAPFKRLVSKGLLFGFPILLFTTVYGLLRSLVGLMASEHKTVWITSGMCLGIGILLFLPMLGAGPLQITGDGVNQALASDQWTQRVAALRHIETRQLEIARYPSYKGLFSDSKVVERYWLARALAGSRTSATFSQLIHLLEDPHPNVICQTFYALGERGERQAIGPIREKMAKTDHWYAQWYGYRALRRLGWHQRPSRQVP